MNLGRVRIEMFETAHADDGFRRVPMGREKLLNVHA
jgi:hypothetical protein